MIEAVFICLLFVCCLFDVQNDIITIPLYIICVCIIVYIILCRIDSSRIHISIIRYTFTKGQ